MHLIYGYEFNNKSYFCQCTTATLIKNNEKYILSRFLLVSMINIINTDDCFVARRWTEQTFYGLEGHKSDKAPIFLPFTHVSKLWKTRTALFLKIYSLNSSHTCNNIFQTRKRTQVPELISKRQNIQDHNKFTENNLSVQIIMATGLTKPIVTDKRGKFIRRDYVYITQWRIKTCLLLIFISKFVS